ncbi:winged helix-turn-helix domain-containing protein [Streptomyces olivaceus]
MTAELPAFREGIRLQAGGRFAAGEKTAAIATVLWVSLSVATVWRLSKRHGWSWQAPARRALERDEHAVEGGVAPGAGAGRRPVPGSSSRTRPASR